MTDEERDRVLKVLRANSTGIIAYDMAGLCDCVAEIAKATSGGTIIRRIVDDGYARIIDYADGFPVLVLTRSGFDLIERKVDA